MARRSSPPPPDPSTAWLRELAGWWHHYNIAYAGEALRPPAFRLDGAAVRLGAWERASRTLSIARLHIVDDPWQRVLQTLRHEMAHQYVDEVLGAHDEPPHGPAFRHACQVLRAEGDDSGTPPDPQARRLAERIEKLLALGDSPHRPEAETALAKARELMLRHNLAALGPGGLGRGTARAFATRWLGPLKGRHPLWEQLLGGLLGAFFFVDVLWVHSYDAQRDAAGTVLEVTGTPENVAMAEYVYGALCGLLDALWREYRREQGLAGDGERTRYFAGVVRGFADKLRRRDAQLRSEHALVWQGDPALAAFVRHRHPRRRGGGARGALMTRAYQDGVAAGRNVELRRPLRGDAGGIAGLLNG